MVRLTRIYTRGGDDGTTSLVGGRRVEKDHLRIESYGTVDELNATLGLCRERAEATLVAGDVRDRVLDLLQTLQQQLFDLGSGLATPPDDRWEGQPVIGADEVLWLEQQIDSLNADLEPLRSFVLPGGGPVGAAMHLARTVCRRAERVTYTLSRAEAVQADELRYLNRLSDLLFVFGRWVAHQTGEPEPLWQPRPRV
ncbi:MAG: hypothetical protein RIT45_1695 [Pseudomonadota bacterium]